MDGEAIMHRAKRIYSYCMALLLLPLAILSCITIGAIGIWIAIASWIETQLDDE